MDETPFLITIRESVAALSTKKRDQAIIDLLV